MTRFSDVYHDYHMHKSVFEDQLIELGFGCWMDFSCDDYDSSVEFYTVQKNGRLNQEAQTFLFNQGFAKAYLNHEDGTETHYTWDYKAFKPVKGWRVNYRTKEVNPMPEQWKTNMGFTENPEL